MRRNGLLLKFFLCFAVFQLHFGTVYASEGNSDFDLLDDDFYQDDSQADQDQIVYEIYDPLEPLNRVFFKVNDKLYYWVVRPVKKGYTAVLPYDVRYIFGNFFRNIAAPVRLVNNLLQGDFKDAGIVLYRFVINTTMGVWGFGDPAEREFGIAPRPADFGQTLGKWGIGEGVYIYWPIIGPSNIRDTVGILGDGYAHPIYFSGQGLAENTVYYLETKVNDMSLQENDLYDEMKRISIDPYVAIRQAYYDYRRGMLEDKKRK